MKWIRVMGQGHAILEKLPDAEVFMLACGQTVPDEGDDLNDIQDADVPTERPFGVDTDRDCHAIVKGWVLNPATQPPGLFDPPTIEERKRRTKEERDALVRGAGLVSMDGGQAGAPEGATTVRRAPGELESVDDLTFPDEPGGGAASPAGNAVFVAPAGKRGRKPKADDGE